MSLDKTTKKHRQTQGKKYSFNLDGDTKSLFEEIQSALQVTTGQPVTATDTIKWLILTGADHIEREIRRHQKQAA